MAPHARHGRRRRARRFRLRGGTGGARGAPDAGTLRPGRREGRREGRRRPAEGGAKGRSPAATISRRSVREVCCGCGIGWRRCHRRAARAATSPRSGTAARTRVDTGSIRRRALVAGGPIEVRQGEVNSYGIGAEGASEKIVQSVERTYKPGTISGLLMWYKQDIGVRCSGCSPTEGRHHAPGSVVRVQLAPEISVARATPREGDVAGAPRATPDQPWPMNSGPWGVSNAQRVHGSPMLDAYVDARTRVGGGERASRTGGRAQGGRRRARVAPRQKIVRGVNERERRARMRRRRFPFSAGRTGAEGSNDDAFFQTVDVRQTEDSRSFEGDGRRDVAEILAPPQPASRLLRDPSRNRSRVFVVV